MNQLLTHLIRDQVCECQFPVLPSLVPFRFLEVMLEAYEFLHVISPGNVFEILLDFATTGVEPRPFGITGESKLVDV